MGPEVAVPLVIGTAAFGTVTSAAQAQQQNAAIKRSQRSVSNAARVQGQQVVDAAAIEKQKRRLQAERAIGRLEVASAAAGVGFGGSYSQLETQAYADLNFNEAVIDANVRNELARIESGAGAQLDTLQSGRTNPILAALQGGFQGAGTGLQIASAASAFDSLATTPPPGGQVYGPEITAETFYSKIKGP